MCSKMAMGQYACPGPRVQLPQEAALTLLNNSDPLIKLKQNLRRHSYALNGSRAPAKMQNLYRSTVPIARNAVPAKNVSLNSKTN